MPIVSCKICAKNFYTKPNWLKKGHGKYCSRECQFKAQRRGKFVSCHRCGKVVWRQPHDLDRSKIFFCNKSCMMKWRNKLQKGPNHPNWTGGRHIDRSALLIKIGIKPSCKRCSRKDQKALLVHHIDGNRYNDDVSNLIFLCHNCHHLVHNYNEPLK